MGKVIITDAGIVNVKPFRKRLFCLHFWHELGVPDELVFLNGRWKFVCMHCGKKKSFRNAPVNFLS